MWDVIVDKAVYHDGVRSECPDPRQEFARLRTAREDGTLAGPGTFVWIGLLNPTQEEFESIRVDLDLHPLAIEDALSANERPKIDAYDGTTVVLLKTLCYIDATSDVETGQIMVFTGPGFVLTVRYGEATELTGVRARLEATPQRLARGPAAAVHAILDAVVDTYVTIDEELTTDLENLEQRVFSGDMDVDVTEIYRLKREVIEFERATMPLVTPMRRAVAGESGIVVPKKLRPFFRDVFDHLMQVVENADAHDRLLSDMLSAHLSQVSVQQNDDMRRISAWVAIAALPTMIAGIYGMNFDNMPELHWKYGYFAVIGVIAASCATLYVLFRRHKWL